MMKKRLQIMACVFLFLATVFSFGAFALLPYRKAEPYYMISGIFVAMAGYCWFGKPR